MWLSRAYSACRHQRHLCNNAVFNFRTSNNSRNEVRRRVFSTKKSEVNSKMVFNEVKEVTVLVLQTTAGLTISLALMGYILELSKEKYPMPPSGEILSLKLVDVNDNNKFINANVHVLDSNDSSSNGHVTVLLDGSTGNTLYEWGKVRQALSSDVRVITIDRPGLGFSAPGNTILPRTSMQIASEYNQILKELNVTGPVILVGHGSGGYNMRLLAKTLDCAGLVLVDAMEENVYDKLKAISSSVSNALERTLGNAEKLYQLSHFGVPRMIDAMQSKKNRSKYLEEDFEHVSYVQSTVGHRRGTWWEYEALAATESYLKTQCPKERLNFPVVVLSHGKKDMFQYSIGMAPDVTPEMVQEMESTWAEGQLDLASRYENSVVYHKTIASVGHLMPQRHPEVIVSAVMALVNDASGKSESDIQNILAKEYCSL